MFIFTTVKSWEYEIMDFVEIFLWFCIDQSILAFFFGILCYPGKSSKTTKHSSIKTTNKEYEQNKPVAAAMDRWWIDINRTCQRSTFKEHWLSVISYRGAFNVYYFFWFFVILARKQLNCCKMHCQLLNIIEFQFVCSSYFLRLMYYFCLMSPLWVFALV